MYALEQPVSYKHHFTAFSLGIYVGIFFTLPYMVALKISLSLKRFMHLNNALTLELHTIVQRQGVKECCWKTCDIFTGVMNV